MQKKLGMKMRLVIFAALWAVCMVPAGLAGQKELPGKGPEMIRLNFRDVDLMAVLELYSGLLGKAFIPDEQIRGKVTVLSPAPVTREEAKKLFFSILDMKQLAIVEYDTYFKIIKKKDAAQSALQVGDPGRGSDKMHTGIIHLTHARADAIVKDLAKLISKDAAIFAAKELNYLVVTATAANIDKIEAIVREIDKPGFLPEARAYKLQYLKAEDFSKTLAHIYEAGRSRSESAVSVVSVAETNSLVITATPVQHEMVQRLIHQMDVLKKQVSISAMFVEVTLTEQTKMGLEWLLQGNSDGVVSGVANDLGSLFNAAPDTLQKIAGEGLKLSVLKTGEFEALAHFLSSTDDAKVVSTPHVLTMENQEAKLRVGNEIPVKKGTRFDSENREISTFEQLKVGLELVVTPVIADNRDITLNIHQTLSNLVSYDEANGTYKSSERETATTVAVKDKDTLVIGGLISHESTKVEKGIPGLKNLPWVGDLFTSYNDKDEMRELLIFITPTVIASRAEAEAMTKEEIKKHPLVVKETGMEFEL